jgi:hypothetical protein
MKEDGQDWWSSLKRKQKENYSYFLRFFLENFFKVFIIDFPILRSL